MDKKKLIFGIIIPLSIIIGYFSYVTQVVYYFYLSALLILLYLVITFIVWARGKNGNFFRVVKGDFGLKGDIDVHGASNKKFPDFLKEPNNYSLIGILLLAFILHIPAHTLILTGLSVISAAAALSVVSFNYFNALKGDVNQIIILASAKRYFLTTLYGIFMLIVLIWIKYLPQLPQVLTNVPIGFISLYLNIFIFAVAIILFVLLISTTLRFLIEGLYLSLKGTIKLDN
ncbi:MAG: hypothetical protein WAK14_08470 [Methanobacterium sp.]